MILPVVWWLLKVTPPAPHQIRFPPIRLLRTLDQTEHTPARTPWWLVWLRLMILALIILGLSGPVLNGRTSPSESLIVVIDDGWSSASHWHKMRAALDDRIEQAKRQNLSILFLPTARSIPPSALEFLPAHRVAKIIEGLVPKPWGIDRQAAAEHLSQLEIPQTTQTLWFSDGLEHPGTRELAIVLQRLGPLEIMLPDRADWPYLLAGSRSGGQIQATITRISSHPDTVLIQAKTKPDSSWTKNPWNLTPIKPKPRQPFPSH